MNITKEFLEYLKKKHDISHSPWKENDYIFYREVGYPYEVIMAIECSNEWEDDAEEFEPIEDYFINNIVEMLDTKKSISKGDRKDIVDTLRQVELMFNNHSPFAINQFNRAIDSTILEAKSAIESYHMDRIITLGTEAYKKELEEKVNEVPKITE